MQKPTDPKLYWETFLTPEGEACASLLLGSRGLVPNKALDVGRVGGVHGLPVRTPLTPHCSTCADSRC